jgi:hypothetical protein
MLYFDVAKDHRKKPAKWPAKITISDMQNVDKKIMQHFDNDMA